MAKKIDMIKDIDGRRKMLKLAVRIIDLWYVESWDSKQSMEMVMMDQKGDVIVAMIKKEDMSPTASIPRKLWKFKTIKDIIDGKCHWCGGNVEEKAHSKNVVFDLKDLRLFSLCMNSYCEKLLSYWRTRSQTSNLVIILTQAKIKAASGPWPMSLSNSWNGSKLIMGDDIPELIDFKKQFAETSRSETFKEGSQYSGSSQISHVDRFMYKTVVKSVSEIITVLEEISCVTVARTFKFNLGNDGWNYLVCNVCMKRTHEVGSFKCLSCDAFNDSPRIRYKLEIQVTDGKKVANFMLWDQDCKNLISVYAADLRKKMIKAFKVKLQEKNRPASIMRVSTDVEIIDHVKALLGQEKASQVGECMVSCPSDMFPDICNSSFIDVPFFTADDEPDIVFCMTPTKDVCATIDDVQDIPSSIMEFDFLEDILLAQLSATKTTKPIKSIKKEKL
ncbi:uncharacterized protein LOC114180624 [Vigna unguiculata]|uniref:uncharacterized protein LOC114180624 n=1 Tax=Vigna unguiculata TaxID=3917 RepID=UPI0010163636|nr:uncharacterized protein LOC114180624 [Vigna unguiculata]